MKKLIFILLIFLFPFVSNAQTWCPVGATWHYFDGFLAWTSYKSGVTELKFTNTVTVNSVLCKEILETFTGISGTPSSPLSTYTVETFITYDANKVYYLYDPYANVFDTICNFNATIGNKWRAPKLPKNINPVCSYPRPVLTVLDTGHVIINSVFLKKIIVQNGYNNLIDTIVEKIGGFNNFFTPHDNCSIIIAGAPYGSFICYEDPNFPLYKKTSTVNCNYDPTSIEENTDDYNISIAPNPSNSEFVVNFKSENLFQVTFFDAIGKEFFPPYNLINDAIYLDFSKINNGIYFVNFFKYGRLINTKKIIKL